MQSFRAYTLMELLIVFAIIAVLSTLGLMGFNGFREYAQLQQAGQSFLADLRTAQNSARNAVLASQDIKPGCNDLGVADSCRLPDGYAIIFDSQDNYSLMSCAFNSLAGVQVSTCFLEKENLKAREFNNITIYPTDEVKCKGIVFARLTGKIYSVTSTSLAPLQNSGLCTIHISGPTGSARDVKLDLGTNSIQTNI